MATLKDLIQTQLKQLQLMGYSRKDIEKALEYSENYITQQLSKGGNQKLLDALSNLKDRLENGDVELEKTSAQAKNTMATLVDTNAKQQAHIMELSKQIFKLQNDLIRCLEKEGNRNNRRSA